MEQAKLFCQRIAFQDWPNSEIPGVAAGVYVIWHNDQLIYCGMSGREIEKHRFSNSKKNMAWLPDLTQVDLEAFRGGKKTLDALTKKYIHQHLEHQYRLLESSQAAYALEAQCRCGDVFGVPPLLNPSKRVLLSNS